MLKHVPEVLKHVPEVLKHVPEVLKYLPEVVNLRFEIVRGRAAFWEAMMNKHRILLALTMALVFVAAAQADDQVVAVQSKNVCMINDRSMANDQIPVEIEGKTYYGCCPMCKERLVKDKASRFAIDPVSGKKVDKAKAVIGALPGAKVLYFESKENLERYNAGARAEAH